MALVTLIIHDLPDGEVDIRAFWEPMPQEGQEAPTKAQAALLVALNAINKAAHEAQPQPQLWTPG